MGLPLAVALLLTLCAHWIHLNIEGRLGYMGLMVRPADYDGQAVVLSLVTVGEVFDAETYQVEEGTLSLRVRGPTADLQVGREITVLGEWDAAQRVVIAREVLPAEGRPAKKRLGILGLLATGLLVPVWFRAGPGGLRIRG